MNLHAPWLVASSEESAAADSSSSTVTTTTTPATTSSSKQARTASASIVSVVIMALFLPQRAASFALAGGRSGLPAHILKRSTLLSESAAAASASASASDVASGSAVSTATTTTATAAAPLPGFFHMSSSLQQQPLPPSWSRTLPSTSLSGDSIAAAREKLEHDMKRNYTLNVGRAIETLRDEVPLMLSEAMDLSIFSEDVTLTDRPGHAIATGKKQYAAFFASLRLARRVTLSNPTVEIKALRYLDWRGEISVKFQITAAAPLGMEPLSFDAVSVYRLNEKGLIDEHRVDDITRMNLFERPSLFEGLPLRNLVFNGPAQSPMPMPF